jgi:hypothetical protein
MIGSPETIPICQISENEKALETRDKACSKKKSEGGRDSSLRLCMVVKPEDPLRESQPVERLFAPVL